MTDLEWIADAERIIAELDPITTSATDPALAMMTASVAACLRGSVKIIRSWQED